MRFFSGRMSRSEWLLKNVGVIVFIIFLIFVGMRIVNNTWGTVLLFLSIALTQLYLLSLHARRLHDIGLSGYYAVLWFIISPLLFVFLLLKRGQEGDNQYGVVTR